MGGSSVAECAAAARGKLSTIGGALCAELSFLYFGYGASSLLAPSGATSSRMGFSWLIKAVRKVNTTNVTNSSAKDTQKIFRWRNFTGILSRATERSNKCKLDL